MLALVRAYDRTLSMSRRLISLASGIHDGSPPSLSPPDLIQVAADAGFNSVGLWIEPGSNWNHRTTGEVLAKIHRTELTILDVEVIWLQPGPKPDPKHHRIIDIGKEIGAKNCLVVSSDPDLENTKLMFEDLCRRAEGSDMRVCLEYMWVTEVKTMDDAMEVVQSVGHPLGGILVDPFHHERVGHAPEKVKEIPDQLLSYCQLCDVPQRGTITDEGEYFADALDGRLCPGEGALPLKELMSALPTNLPISLEIRSQHYRTKYEDPLARAKQIYKKSLNFLESL